MITTNRTMVNSGITTTLQGVNVPLSETLGTVPVSEVINTPPVLSYNPTTNSTAPTTTTTDTSKSVGSPVAEPTFYQKNKFLIWGIGGGLLLVTAILIALNPFKASK